VGIGFKIREKPVLFIGCHLTASQHNDKKRAYDFNRINKKLNIFQNISDKQASSKRVDAAIWAGDMNFRIDGPKNVVEFLIDNGFADILRRSD